MVVQDGLSQVEVGRRPRISNKAIGILLTKYKGCAELVKESTGFARNLGRPEQRRK